MYGEVQWSRVGFCDVVYFLVWLCGVRRSWVPSGAVKYCFL